MIYEIIRKLTDAANMYDVACWTWVDDHRDHPVLRVKFIEHEFGKHKDYSISISETVLMRTDPEEMVKTIMQDMVKSLLPYLIQN